MNYEEKYKEALGWMRSLYNGLHGVTKEEAEHYFPELKVSDSERIKFLIKSCVYASNITPEGREEIFAWLEKQGKQDARYEDIEKLLEADTIYQMSMNDAMVEEAKSKAINALSELAISKILGLEKQGIQPTDKAEPKFKVGDWIVLPLGIIAHIESLNSTDYQVTTTDGKICDFKISKQDNYRLWTINDAKKGDALASGQVVFIFKVIRDGWLYCHCSYHNDGSLIAESYDMMTYKYFSEVHPATKEQRDLLFKKMKEAGYEWNAEKKELKKMEVASKEGDDERIRKAILELVKQSSEILGKQNQNNMIAWLEKQDDVNEISAEWSEKDEQMILSIEQVMNCASLLNIVPEKIDNIKSWLKSLRPQKQWNPSTAHKREIAR